MSQAPISDELATMIVTNGKFYFRADDHYTRGTTVICDRCFASHISACFGVDEFSRKLDVCLDCAKFLTNRAHCDRTRCFPQISSQITTPPTTTPIIPSQPIQWFTTMSQTSGTPSGMPFTVTPSEAPSGTSFRTFPYVALSGIPSVAPVETAQTPSGTPMTITFQFSTTK